MTASASQRVPQLVYTGNGGDLFTLASADQQVRQLTWSWEEKKANDTDQTSARLNYIWPAWAPDGSRVACFGMYGSSELATRTSLYTIAADGIESWELAKLAGGVPIYGNWSPRGDTFAALIQRGTKQLSLETVALAHPGETTSLLKGAPLFWSWSPRGDMLAVHIGGSDRDAVTARVLLLDAASGQIVREISRHPGEFRVPAWAPHDDLLAYVEQGTDGVNTLVLFDVATGEKGPVATTSGATTALWSADGRFLVFGCTSHPGSLVFSQVSVLDLSSGHVLPLLNEAVIGFFWSPRGEALYYLSIDAQRSHLRWHRVMRESGEKTELVRFLPTREQTFIFSFFDQYARSHPSIALDGSALAFAGYLFGAEQSDTTPSRIYVVPLDRPAEPHPVAPGHFVCWNPA